MQTAQGTMMGNKEAAKGRRQHPQHKDHGKNEEGDTGIPDLIRIIRKSLDEAASLVEGGQEIASSKSKKKSRRVHFAAGKAECRDTQNFWTIHYRPSFSDDTVSGNNGASQIADSLQNCGMPPSAFPPRWIGKVVPKSVRKPSRTHKLPLPLEMVQSLLRAAELSAMLKEAERGFLANHHHHHSDGDAASVRNQEELFGCHSRIDNQEVISLAPILSFVDKEVGDDQSTRMRIRNMTRILRRAQMFTMEHCTLCQGEQRTQWSMNVGISYKRDEYISFGRTRLGKFIRQCLDTKYQRPTQKPLLSKLPSKQRQPQPQAAKGGKDTGAPARKNVRWEMVEVKATARGTIATVKRLRSLPQKVKEASTVVDSLIRSGQKPPKKSSSKPKSHKAISKQRVPVSPLEYSEPDSIAPKKSAIAAGQNKVGSTILQSKSRRDRSQQDSLTQPNLYESKAPVAKKENSSTKRKQQPTDSNADESSKMDSLCLLTSPSPTAQQDSVNHNCPSPPQPLRLFANLSPPKAEEIDDTTKMKVKRRKKSPSQPAGILETMFAEGTAAEEKKEDGSPKTMFDSLGTIGKSWGRVGPHFWHTPRSLSKLKAFDQIAATSTKAASKVPSATKLSDQNDEQNALIPPKNAVTTTAKVPSIAKPSNGSQKNEKIRNISSDDYVAAGTAPSAAALFAESDDDEQDGIDSPNADMVTAATLSTEEDEEVRDVSPDDYVVVGTAPSAATLFAESEDEESDGIDPLNGVISTAATSCTEEDNEVTAPSAESEDDKQDGIDPPSEGMPVAAAISTPSDEYDGQDGIDPLNDDMTPTAPSSTEEDEATRNIAPDVDVAAVTAATPFAESEDEKQDGIGRTDGSSAVVRASAVHDEQGKIDPPYEAIATATISSKEEDKEVPQDGIDPPTHNLTAGTPPSATVSPSDGYDEQDEIDPPNEAIATTATSSTEEDNKVRKISPNVINVAAVTAAPAVTLFAKTKDDEHDGTVRRNEDMVTTTTISTKEHDEVRNISPSDYAAAGTAVAAVRPSIRSGEQNAIIAAPHLVEFVATVPRINDEPDAFIPPNSAMATPAISLSAATAAATSSNEDDEEVQEIPPKDLMAATTPFVEAQYHTQSGIDPLSEDMIMAAAIRKPSHECDEEDGIDSMNEVNATPKASSTEDTEVRHIPLNDHVAVVTAAPTSTMFAEPEDCEEDGTITLHEIIAAATNDSSTSGRPLDEYDEVNATIQLSNAMAASAMSSSASSSTEEDEGVSEISPNGCVAAIAATGPSIRHGEQNGIIAPNNIMTMSATAISPPPLAVSTAENNEQERIILLDKLMAVVVAAAGIKPSNGHNEVATRFPSSARVEATLGTSWSEHYDQNHEQDSMRSPNNAMDSAPMPSLPATSLAENGESGDATFAAAPATSSRENNEQDRLMTSHDVMPRATTTTLSRSAVAAENDEEDSKIQANDLVTAAATSSARTSLTENEYGETCPASDMTVAAAITAAVTAALLLEYNERDSSIQSNDVDAATATPPIHSPVWTENHEHGEMTACDDITTASLHESDEWDITSASDVTMAKTTTTTTPSPVLTGNDEHAKPDHTKTVLTVAATSLTEEIISPATVEDMTAMMAPSASEAKLLTTINGFDDVTTAATSLIDDGQKERMIASNAITTVSTAVLPAAATITTTMAMGENAEENAIIIAAADKKQGKKASPERRGEVAETKASEIRRSSRSTKYNGSYMFDLFGGRIDYFSADMTSNGEVHSSVHEDDDAAITSRNLPTRTAQSESLQPAAPRRDNKTVGDQGEGAATRRKSRSQQADPVLPAAESLSPETQNDGKLSKIFSVETLESVGHHFKTNDEMKEETEYAAKSPGEMIEDTVTRAKPGGRVSSTSTRYSASPLSVLMTSTDRQGNSTESTEAERRNRGDDVTQNSPSLKTEISITPQRDTGSAKRSSKRRKTAVVPYLSSPLVSAASKGASSPQMRAKKGKRIRQARKINSNMTQLDSLSRLGSPSPSTKLWQCNSGKNLVADFMSRKQSSAQTALKRANLKIPSAIDSSRNNGDDSQTNSKLVTKPNFNHELDAPIEVTEQKPIDTVQTALEVGPEIKPYADGDEIRSKNQYNREDNVSVRTDSPKQTDGSTTFDNPSSITIAVLTSEVPENVPLSEVTNKQRSQEGNVERIDQNECTSPIIPSLPRGKGRGWRDNNLVNLHESHQDGKANVLECHETFGSVSATATCLKAKLVDVTKRVLFEYGVEANYYSHQSNFQHNFAAYYSGVQDDANNAGGISRDVKHNIDGESSSHIPRQRPVPISVADSMDANLNDVTLTTVSNSLTTRDSRLPPKLPHDKVASNSHSDSEYEQSEASSDRSDHEKSHLASAAGDTLQNGVEATVNDRSTAADAHMPGKRSIYEISRLYRSNEQNEATSCIQIEETAVSSESGCESVQRVLQKRMDTTSDRAACDLVIDERRATSEVVSISTLLIDSIAGRGEFDISGPSILIADETCIVGEGVDSLDQDFVDTVALASSDRNETCDGHETGVACEPLKGDLGGGSPPFIPTKHDRLNPFSSVDDQAEDGVAIINPLPKEDNESLTDEDNNEGVSEHDVSAVRAKRHVVKEAAACAGSEVQDDEQHRTCSTTISIVTFKSEESSKAGDSHVSDERSCAPIENHTRDTSATEGEVDVPFDRNVSCGDEAQSTTNPVIGPMCALERRTKNTYLMGMHSQESEENKKECVYDATATSSMMPDNTSHVAPVKSPTEGYEIKASLEPVLGSTVQEASSRMPAAGSKFGDAQGALVQQAVDSGSKSTTPAIQTRNSVLLSCEAQRSPPLSQAANLPKKRGRPKKSSSRQVRRLLCDLTDADRPWEDAPPKKKRGRPRKIVRSENEIVVVERRLKEGRPKRLAAGRKESVQYHENTNGYCSASSWQESLESAPSSKPEEPIEKPPKKRRGRPPKNSSGRHPVPSSAPTPPVATASWVHLSHLGLISDFHGLQRKYAGFLPIHGCETPETAVTSIRSILISAKAHEKLSSSTPATGGDTDGDAHVVDLEAVHGVDHKVARRVVRQAAYMGYPKQVQRNRRSRSVQGEGAYALGTGTSAYSLKNDGNKISDKGKPIRDFGSMPIFFEGSPDAMSESELESCCAARDCSLCSKNTPTNSGMQALPGGFRRLFDDADAAIALEMNEMAGGRPRRTALLGYQREISIRLLRETIFTLRFISKFNKGLIKPPLPEAESSSPASGGQSGHDEQLKVESGGESENEEGSTSEGESEHDSVKSANSLLVVEREIPVEREWPKLDTRPTVECTLNYLDLPQNENTGIQTSDEVLKMISQKLTTIVVDDEEDTDDEEAAQNPTRYNAIIRSFNGLADQEKLEKKRHEEEAELQLRELEYERRTKLSKQTREAKKLDKDRSEIRRRPIIFQQANGCKEGPVVCDYKPSCPLCIPKHDVSQHVRENVLNPLCKKVTDDDLFGDDERDLPPDESAARATKIKALRLREMENNLQFLKRYNEGLLETKRGKRRFGLAAPTKSQGFNSTPKKQKVLPGPRK